ncbi:hypothetical protein AB6A40_005919 [Gnathostoma spinigerum]|uniref:Uncharacterized protein n=1 Tax=Gnathostoma spinigerum TaxID=75299 RepID=A0ABD6EI01_9BILA
MLTGGVPRICQPLQPSSYASVISRAANENQWSRNERFWAKQFAAKYEYVLQFFADQSLLKQNEEARELMSRNILTAWDELKNKVKNVQIGDLGTVEEFINCGKHYSKP